MEGRTDVSFALMPVLKISEVVVIRKDCPAQKIVALGLRSVQLGPREPPPHGAIPT